MEDRRLIIVTGPPCAGKTTLAEQIASEFGLPLITKDGIKEMLFDAARSGDREWSKHLGLISFRLMDYFMESLMKAGHPLILEANFRPANDSGKLKAVADKYKYQVLQVFCTAEQDVLLRRYSERAASGTRHPGHVDQLAYPDFQRSLRDHEYAPLEAGGELIKVDTTNFGRIDHAPIIERLRGFLF